MSPSSGALSGSCCRENATFEPRGFQHKPLFFRTCMNFPKLRRSTYRVYIFLDSSNISDVSFCIQVDHGRYSPLSPRDRQRFAGTCCRYIDDGFSLLNRLQVAKGTTCLHLSAQSKLRPSLLQLECHVFGTVKKFKREKTESIPISSWHIHHIP